MRETKETDFGFERVAPEDKATRVAQVFDRVADRYDLMNDLMSLGLHRAWTAFAVALARVRPGERVLDLGCGDGALTEKIAASGAWVVGADLSRDLVTATRARGLPAVVADGRALCFAGVCDAILTNAALHWIKPPEAVIDGMWRALKPGGRLVGEMGGEGNVAAIAGALIAAMARRGLDGNAAFPWYFPSTTAYRSLLEARGFQVASIELIRRPTELPGDITGWFETFGESFLLAVPAPQRADFIAEAVEALRQAILACDLPQVTKLPGAAASS